MLRWAVGALVVLAAPAAADQVTFHGALHGNILSYAVDATGSEGMLGEYVQHGDEFDTAIETFDLSTGATVSTIRRRRHSNGMDFVPFGVMGDHTGLFLTEKTSRRTGRVSDDIYETLAPLSGNTVTGTWTPPFGRRSNMVAMSRELSSGTTVFVGEHFRTRDTLYLFSSQVSANSFTPLWRLPKKIRVGTWAEYDPVSGLAILNGLCNQCAVPLYTADLATGQTHKIATFGKGSITGMAIDPADRVLCTVTEQDFSIEFTNLDTHAVQSFVLPNATAVAHLGTFVAYDAAHGLFLVSQEHSSLGSGNLYLYAPDGTLTGTINGVNATLAGFNSTLRKAYGITNATTMVMVDY